MKLIPIFSKLLVVFFLAAQSGWAADPGWDVRLAGKFSARLREIDRDLAKLAPGLEGLPKIPIDDQGGTGGYANIYSDASPPAKSRYAVEVHWKEIRAVDMVALVPTRRYDAKGLDAQYGMPDAFTVELIGGKGEVLATLARERNARSNPVRRGHPFVYQVSPPVEAAGLRIAADVLRPDTEDEVKFVHAWAEVFAFEGERNIARGQKVVSIGGSAAPAPWHWNPAFLVDGQTPLGLPEIPEEHGNIGWISEGREKASETATLSVDLGEPAAVDSVRFLPAKRPTSDLPSGFGFPRKLSISVSETGESGERGNWILVANSDFRNPGHNPVLASFPPTRGRFVRIEATELWKAFENYPAFFALSEVEVLSGDRNLALGKVVRSSDGMLNLIAPGD